MKRKMLFGFFAVLISFSLAALVECLASQWGEKRGWMGHPIIFLSMLFFFDMEKSTKGESILWHLLEPRDKLIYLFDLIIIFTFSTYPVMEGKEWVVIFVFTVFGFFLSWLFTSLLASQRGKMLIFPSKKPIP